MFYLYISGKWVIYAVKIKILLCYISIKIMSNFIYSRKIHFADTDSAGVVYFSNLLSICHEAYEEVLLSLGINLSNFFLQISN